MTTDSKDAPVATPEVESLAAPFDLRSDAIPSFGFLQHQRAHVFVDRHAHASFRRLVEELPEEGEAGRRRALGLWMVGEFEAAARALERYADDVLTLLFWATTVEEGLDARTPETGLFALAFYSAEERATRGDDLDRRIRARVMEYWNTDRPGARG